MAIRPTNLHAVGYAWLASRSVTDAIGRLARFGRVVSSAGRVRPQSVGDELVVDIELHDRMPQQSIDAYTSAIVALVREISDQTFAPLRVEMRRPEPPCARELDAFFRCPITYGAARQRLVFRRDDADRSLPRQDAAMAQASDEVAARYIARLDRTDVVARARIELVAMLSDGEPTRRALAARLHTSERTLSRRLREAGISFRALLDDVRREFAQNLLSQSQYSVTEVTFLLGFADQSNFARSFRRWTGQSPSDYRTNLR
jgi:AraC-like DNA-binding protein